MKHVYLRWSAVVVGFLFAVCAHSQTRPHGWEFRADLLYQNQKDVRTQGGSDVNLDTNWGGSLGTAYRFNPYAEMYFMLDLQSINYDARVMRADGTNRTFDVSDKIDITTPRVGVNVNFLDYHITPYVSTGIGWSFTSADIPNAKTQVGCIWDPWYGYICGPYKSTYNNDSFEWDIGVGLRWDITSNFGMRFSYEKHWVDLSGPAGTPNFDQFRIGIQFGH